MILLGGQQGGSKDEHTSGKGNNSGLVSQPRGRAATAGAPPDDLSARGLQMTTSLFESGPLQFLTDANLLSCDVSGRRFVTPSHFVFTH